METERILLRHWQESDAEALFKYASAPDVGPVLDGRHISLKRKSGDYPDLFQQ